MDKVKKFAEDNNYSLEAFDIKKRKQNIVTNTLHQAGIVVPYNKKTQLGYRPLVENDSMYNKLIIFSLIIKRGRSNGVIDEHGMSMTRRELKYIILEEC